MRWYLAFIVVIGVCSSMIGSMLSRGPAPDTRERTHLVADSADAADRSYASSVAEQPSDGSVQLERSDNGHFYADVEINGAVVNALVDTGATGIALSREDARKAGIAISIGMPDVVGKGADGDVRGEFVSLDSVSLGGKTVEGMSAMVLNSGEQSLLGQSFLSKFESVEIRGDTMVLR